MAASGYDSLAKSQGTKWFVGAVCECEVRVLTGKVVPSLVARHPLLAGPRGVGEREGEGSLLARQLGLKRWMP